MAAGGDEKCGLAGQGGDDDIVFSDKPELPRRFYSSVAIRQGNEGNAVVIDNLPISTPGKAKLVLPNQALAEDVAQEWRAQKDYIDPQSMPLTRLSNTAIDLIVSRKPMIVDDIARFAMTDLICYRADEPEELVMKQMAQWDPVLDWTAQALGAAFTRSSGVMHVEQPAAAVSRIKAAVEPFDTFSLTAMHTMTALTNSALLVLAHVAGRFDAQTCWQAAHLDEDWQISKWGQDAEAKSRRECQWCEMQAAARMFSLVNASLT